MLTVKRVSIIFAVGSIGCLIASAYVGCFSPAKPAEFDPKLHLQWPGAPEIVGDSKHYTATLIHKGANGTIFLSAHVDDDPGFAKLSPRDALDSFTFAFRKNETSRKEIEVGPKKYPGLQITSKHDLNGRFRFERKLVYVSGTRIATVSVSSTNENLVNGSEASAFLDSLQTRD
ncbi:MAG TPA: hypothetical protein VKD71_09635 [Gemmataceae bacterium]|nr:hypothetical protein [Gemmataceae bacterium]